MRTAPAVVLVIAVLGLACSGGPVASTGVDPAELPTPAATASAAPTSPAPTATGDEAPSDADAEADAQVDGDGSPATPPGVDPAAVTAVVWSTDEMSGRTGAMMTLTSDTTIAGVPCAKGPASYEDDGRVWSCKLGGPLHAHGIDLDAGHGVRFDEHGTVTGADLATGRDVPVEGVPCKELVEWHQDHLWRCYLAEDHAFASGLTLPAGLAVYFEDGRPASSELEDPATIGGVAYEAGHTLSFSADGKVEDEGETPGD